MEAIIRQGALLLGVLGVLVLAIALLLGRRRWLQSSSVALDLWTAAVLLDLAGAGGWSEIAAAAAFLAIRLLFSLRLRLRPGLS